MTGTVKLVSAGGGSVSMVTPSTGSNRTVTLPDANVTIPTAHSQATLTTQGDILYASGANTLARLAKGTAAQTLKMNSGATAPEWTTVAAPTAPAMVKLNTFETTAGDNVQACNLNVYFTSSYDTYLLIANVSPDDANSDFSWRVMRSGSVVTASEYVGHAFRGYNDTSDNNQISTGEPTAGDYNNPDDGIFPHADDMVDGDLTRTSTLELWLYNPLSTSEWKRFKSTFMFQAAYNMNTHYQNGQVQNTAALSGVSFYMNNSSTDIVCKGALYGLTI